MDFTSTACTTAELVAVQNRIALRWIEIDISPAAQPHKQDTNIRADARDESRWNMFN